ncbi:hypothetical protein [Sphingobium sp. WCS2017Hpa-17]|uniref:hypothetical protein n=1 Tax=Sphingobium sp. WCS2017Hpa-17 TaxID=3073638 RepID=UPI00288A3BFA|nr:hypothetical protein [Sphingobium sp. WCS2017Hpa-17]
MDHQILPNKIVALLFGWTWTGFALFALILVLAAYIIVRTYWRYYRPSRTALEARLAATDIIARQETDADAQAAFADHYDDIAAAMTAGGKGTGELRHAWTQFTETFVDPNDRPLRATSRPEGYFLHLSDDSRLLAWWANIFVATGLTLTFFGIIAALVGAVSSMSSGADMAQVQKALVDLLTMTATKFWTSIGGVLASIVLRMVDRKWHSATDKRLETLCERLEYGTLFSPPQRIAAQQLRELEQQSLALTEFSQQLAASIGDALGQHMQPVVAGLSGIQTSINDFKDGSFNQIGKELGEAISRNAGSEMEGLAAALTGMTSGLQGVNDRLEGASGAASEQIATAAREFSTASEHMTQAFAELYGRIDGMSRSLASQSDEAERRTAQRVEEDRASYDAMAQGQREVMRAMGEEMQSASAAASEAMVAAVRGAVRDAMAESSTAIGAALEGFAGATSGIQSAFDHMRGQIADLGEALSGSAQGAAERNAEVLAKAATALEAATARAQTGMGAALDEAINRSTEASSRAIGQAFEAFGARFETASAGLVQTLTTTAGRMEALAGAIERSAGAADSHAGKLADAGREAQGVATMLGRAANDLHKVADPIRVATDSIDKAATWTNETLKEMDRRNGIQQEMMRGIADSLTATSGAAAQAWNGYRDRFEAVDEALGRALDQIGQASQEHATGLNEHVGRIDLALADAVDRLGSALDVIKDLAEALEDRNGPGGRG